MKKFVFVFLSALVSMSSFAAQVENASVITRDDGSYALSIDVRYTGGCKKHQFQLQVGACFETMPVQCEARLVDLTSGDFCEAIRYETVEIGLDEAGLVESYFSNGSLTITGALGSEASVRLPTIE